jgi:hypothetical protein
VYLRQALATRSGAGVEFAFSAPITDRSWQQLNVKLVGTSPLHLRRWDHRTGHVPIEYDQWRSCGVFYPRAGALGEMEVLAGLSRSLPVQPETGRGRWLRVRIQILPDGRCGIALDGRPVLLLERPIPLGDSALVVISAYSHRTQILVGPVTVWEGVRRDVKWAGAQNLTTTPAARP